LGVGDAGRQEKAAAGTRPETLRESGCLAAHGLGIVPGMTNRKRRLITSALPYVNNIPHLGNLIQVLSADVFARYCRLRGYETLYVCGTDEYGTATETRAREEGITPQELCDRYYRVHTDIYEWFTIAFDKWGRTSTPEHTEITQRIFKGLDANGYIKEQTIKQLYSPGDDMFLADRYVMGTCPHCGYEDARGDQCENCGKLLDPMELIDPRSALSGDTPEVRETTHLYIDLPGILPKLQEWMKEASVSGHWANNAIKMTNAWIRDGLKERAITRDLMWGIPVPKEGFEDKVFYVWFDAPIGYISITATYTDRWESWWQSPDDVDLYQFIGKDNIPFHTVIFPSSCIGSGEKWTLLHHMSSSEYLNYESGKFSKSRGTGVFGNDAMDTGIPADVWRFYIFYNRPETSDAMFTWKDFQEKVNGELIGNFSNLVNRTLSFVERGFDGLVPDGEPDEAFWADVRRREVAIGEALEGVELRRAFHEIFALSSVGNKRFQDAEPWRVIKENKEAVAGLLRDLVYLIRDLAVLMHPYIPSTAEKVASALGVEKLSWKTLGRLEGLELVKRPDLLFAKLEDKEIYHFRDRFAGSQADREEAAGLPAQFAEKVELRIARIEAVERHPKADKLYVETISFGEGTGGETRQIVSGLVPHYKEDELLGRNVVVVMNLRAARLRGVESQGMLLAAETGDIVEVVFAPHAQPGDRVVPEGLEAAEGPDEITIDEFFAIPIDVESHRLKVEGKDLIVAGKPLTAERVSDGEVR
jgi:methionyl-tRNA synthetase